MKESDLNKLLKSWYTDKKVWKMIKVYIKNEMFKGVKSK